MIPPCSTPTCLWGKLRGSTACRCRLSNLYIGLRDQAGGGSGIRTRDTVARIHAFQACAFSHSAIPPTPLRPRRAREVAGAGEPAGGAHYRLHLPRRKVSCAGRASAREPRVQAPPPGADRETRNSAQRIDVPVYCANEGADKGVSARRRLRPAPRRRWARRTRRWPRPATGCWPRRAPGDATGSTPRHRADGRKR